MKKRGKILIIVALIAFLLIPVTASAYSGSYSFDIYSSVHGTKKHSLSAKSTSTTVKANTYLGNTNNILSVNYHIIPSETGRFFSNSFGIFLYSSEIIC